MRHLTIAALLIHLVLYAAYAQALTPVTPVTPPTAVDPDSRPVTSMRVFGGQLTGDNRGEWGGSLTFVDRTGKSREMLKSNVIGMYWTPSAVLVFTGLAHLGLNEGAIYRVRANGDGQVEIGLLYRLSGEPSKLNRLGDGVITFQVFTGRFESDTAPLAKPVYDCQSLDRDFKLQPCPAGAR